MSLLLLILLAALTTANAASLGDSCLTPNNTAGTCISLYDCPELITLLKLPVKTPEEANYIQKSKCGPFIGRIPVVCCSNLPLINREGCGFSAANRIFGGSETELGEFPWMAVLNYKSGKVFRDQCGGSLITDQYILTAAHCISNKLSYVRLGEHDVRTDPDGREYDTGTVYADPVQTFTIKRKIIHPNYSTKTHVNDIALIQINRPANLSEYVKPICLPVDETNLEGKTVTVAGWGVTEQNTTSFVLMKTHVPMMSLEECQEAFLKKGARLSLSDNQLCAGGDGVSDSCSGDSGGPMKSFADGSEQYTQFGIVSYGPRRCATPGLPAVYTAVSKYIPWILETITP